MGQCLKDMWTWWKLKDKKYGLECVDYKFLGNVNKCEALVKSLHIEMKY